MLRTLLTADPGTLPTAVAARSLLAVDRAWTDIPAVRVIGAVVGGLLLLAAIRAMFGKGR